MEAQRSTHDSFCWLLLCFTCLVLLVSVRDSGATSDSDFFFIFIFFAPLFLCVSVSALLEFNQSVIVSRKDPESRKKAVAHISERLTSNGYWPQVSSPVVGVLVYFNRNKSFASRKMVNKYQNGTLLQLNPALTTSSPAP